MEENLKRSLVLFGWDPERVEGLDFAELGEREWLEVLQAMEQMPDRSANATKRAHIWLQGTLKQKVGGEIYLRLGYKAQVVEVGEGEESS